MPSSLPYLFFRTNLEVKYLRIITVELCQFTVHRRTLHVNRIYQNATSYHKLGDGGAGVVAVVDVRDSGYR